MVQLVILLCSLSQPVICREQRPVYDPPLSLMACMVGGQRAAAEFLANHPSWELQGWRCEVGVPKRRDA